RGVDPLGRRDPPRAGAALVKAALAILAVALVAVPAADGYRNPTPGKAVVLQIAGMHRAKVRGTSSTRSRRFCAGRLPTANRSWSPAGRPPRRSARPRPEQRPEDRLGAADRRDRPERDRVRRPLRRPAAVAEQPRS